MHRPSKARDRIVQAAYELFTAHGINSVGIDAIIARSGVARMTLYRHFASKNNLVLAFLDHREALWTRRWLTAEVLRRATEPRDRLIGIFDLYDEWFRKPDFEGCAFTRVLLESEPGSPVEKSAAEKLDKIREFVEALARDAEFSDAKSLAQVWCALLHGAMVAACGGQANAARDAKRAAQLLLQGWEGR